MLYLGLRNKNHLVGFPKILAFVFTMRARYYYGERLVVSGLSGLQQWPHLGVMPTLSPPVAAACKHVTRTKMKVILILKYFRALMVHNNNPIT